MPETLGLKLLIQEMSARQQHFSMPHPGSSGNQSLERSVPGLQIREKCARAPVPYVFPLALHPPGTGVTGVGRVHLSFRAESLLLQTHWWAGLTPRVAGCVGWPGLFMARPGYKIGLWDNWL